MAGDKSDNKRNQQAISKPPAGGDSSRNKAQPAKVEAATDKEKSKLAKEIGEGRAASSNDSGKSAAVKADDAAKPAEAKVENKPEREKLLEVQQVDVTQDPNVAARPPGRAPSGDARSFRNDEEFCLIYRRGSYLITRRGQMGKMGTWSVVEYPDKGSAAHAYAEECSNLGAEGFSDFRGE